MDFTREPIIESVVTPREGCKLVVRSSKSAGQEEFFVDAVEIVSFGGTFFLRSLEKPKSFLVPATDYEILEVRETRMVLKNVGVDRSIKIGGGKEVVKKAVKEPVVKSPVSEEVEEKVEVKKRERRRHYRKRRGKEGVEQSVQAEGGGEDSQFQEKGRLSTIATLEKEGVGRPVGTSVMFSSLLPPPSTLISESIERYKGNELFKNVFIPKEDRKEGESVEEEEFFKDIESVDEPTVEWSAPVTGVQDDDIFSEPHSLSDREESKPIDDVGEI